MPEMMKMGAENITKRITEENKTIRKVLERETQVKRKRHNLRLTAKEKIKDRECLSYRLRWKRNKPRRRFLASCRFESDEAGLWLRS